MSDFSFATPAPSATQSLNGLGKRFRNPTSALGNVLAGVWITYCSPLRRSDALQGLSRNKRPTPGQAIRTTLARCKQTPQQLPLANKKRPRARGGTRAHHVNTCEASVLASRFSSCFSVFAFRYCSKSTSLLSRKNNSATRATAAIPPMYQPSAWMPNVMTRADAMVGANAPPVMAARL